MNSSQEVSVRKKQRVHQANPYTYSCGSSTEISLLLKANENTNPFWKTQICNVDGKFLAFVILKQLAFEAFGLTD